MECEIIETDEKKFVEQSAEFLTESIRSALQQNDTCIVGLSGGSTPRPIYELLGKAEGIDWSSVYLFLVDERHVPADNPDSNQSLVRDTLLLHADVPSDHLYFPDTSLSMQDCIVAYSQSLIQLFEKQPPHLMTLGLGPDGHIASLFPPVSEDAFGEVLALHTTTDAFAVHDRISVSPLVIMAAQKHVLLLKGTEKKKVFDECRAADMDPVRWPLHTALATGRVTTIVC